MKGIYKEFVSILKSSGDSEQNNNLLKEELKKYETDEDFEYLIKLENELRRHNIEGSYLFDFIPKNEPIPKNAIFILEFFTKYPKIIQFLPMAKGHSIDYGFPTLNDKPNDIIAWVNSLEIKNQTILANAIRKYLIKNKIKLNITNIEIKLNEFGVYYFSIDSEEYMSENEAFTSQYITDLIKNTPTIASRINIVIKIKKWEDIYENCIPNEIKQLFFKKTEKQLPNTKSFIILEPIENLNEIEITHESDLPKLINYINVYYGFYLPKLFERLRKKEITPDLNEQQIRQINRTNSRIQSIENDILVFVKTPDKLIIKKIIQMINILDNIDGFQLPNKENYSLGKMDNYKLEKLKKSLPF